MQLHFLSYLTRMVYGPSFSYSLVEKESGTNKWIIIQPKLNGDR